MRSGAKAPPGFHSPRSATPPTAHSTHIFAGLQTCGLLIRPAKTSHTAGTLCDIIFQDKMRHILVAQKI
jgi:hypothetical protein